MTMKLKSAFLAACLCAGALGASAQGLYDDDIYYNAAKDTKAKAQREAYRKAQAEQRQREQEEYEAQMAYLRSLANAQSSYNPNLGGGNFAPADTYTPLAGQGSSRSVDEYNRRGAYAPKDTLAMGSQGTDADNFAYTRRIERFHNGDVISSVNDPDLVDYYYASAQQQPEVNIYLVNPGWSNWTSMGGWYGGYPWWRGSSYWAWNNCWRPSWSWGWNSCWGPSWSLGWGSPYWDPFYDPYWAWGWGGSWGWGHHHYYPGWGYPGWGPEWGGGAISTANYTPRGRQSTGIRNGYTGLGSSRPSSPFNRRGTSTGVTPQSLGNYRPGSSSRPASSSSSNGSYRPGSYSPSYGTGSSSSGSYNSNSGRSGRSSSNSSSSYRDNSSSRSSSSSSWGGSSSGSSRGSSSGSYGGSTRSGRR